MTQNKSGSNSWIGIVLIIVGALFLMDTFDLIEFGNFFSEWWPIIFVIIALVKFQNQERGAGILFLIIAGLLLMLTNDMISWGSIWRLWPIIIILFGISLILKGRNSSWSLVNDATIGDDYINSNAIFGGAEHLITSQNFKGGEAMAGLIELMNLYSELEK